MQERIMGVQHVFAASAQYSDCAVKG